MTRIMQQKCQKNPRHTKTGSNYQDLKDVKERKRETQRRTETAFHPPPRQTDLTTIHQHQYRQLHYGLMCDITSSFLTTDAYSCIWAPFIKRGTCTCCAAVPSGSQLAFNGFVSASWLAHVTPLINCKQQPYVKTQSWKVFPRESPQPLTSSSLLAERSSLCLVPCFF